MRDISKLDGCVGCLALCRCATLFVILCCGCAITHSIGGSQYYIWTEGGEGSLPECQAVLYAVNDASVHIDLGKFGGGSLVDAGVNFATPQVVLAALTKISWNVTMEAIREAPLFISERCQVIMPIVGEQLHPENGYVMGAWVLLLNPVDGTQVKFGRECGGDAPGVWLRGTTEGVRKTPVIACLITWFLFRIAGLTLEFAVFKGADRNSGAWAQRARGCIVWLIFSSGSSVMIGPIQNIVVSDYCPQILQTYYSSHGCEWFAVVGSVNALIFFLLVATELPKSIADGKASETVASTFALNWRRAGEQCRCPVLVRLGFLLIPAMPCTMILMTVIYKGFEAASMSWTVIFGININLKMKFPEFNLSKTVNAFHIFAFLMWILDMLKLFADFAAKTSKVRDTQ